MWISKDEWKLLQKKIADLENGVSNQRLYIEVLLEFCRSVANADGKDLFSYQQLYAPSADSCDKVCMLFQKIRKS